MTPTRILRVSNPAPTPFFGIAVLPVAFRTRTIAPVTVRSPDGAVTPSRIAGETIGPIEADGKRRWVFELEFLVAVPAGATIACTATWGTSPNPTPWRDPPAATPRLHAIECEEEREDG